MKRSLCLTVVCLPVARQISKIVRSKIVSGWPLLQSGHPGHSAEPPLSDRCICKISAECAGPLLVKMLMIDPYLMTSLSYEIRLLLALWTIHVACMDAQDIQRPVVKRPLLHHCAPGSRDKI